MDEEFVFRSLTKYNLGEFFGVLEPLQSFPRIHLICIKLLSQGFNYHVLALRFISLVSMISAFFVWVKLYQKKLSGTWLFPLCLLAFAGSYRLIYYAAELKPYAMDMLVVALYALFLNYQQNFDNNRSKFFLYLFSFLLPLTVFFSYAALFVIWMAGYHFIRRAGKDRTFRKIAIIHILEVVVCLIVFYNIDLKYSITEAGIDYWSSYFLCPGSVGCFLDTFGEGVRRLVTYWYGTEKIHYRFGSIFIPFFFFGLIKFGFMNLKKSRFVISDIDSLGFVLFCEMILLGLWQKYPFTGERLTLFFAPVTFYFIVKTVDLVPKGRWIYLRCALFTYYAGYCLFCLSNSFYLLLKLYQ